MTSNVKQKPSAKPKAGASTDGGGPSTDVTSPDSKRGSSSPCAVTIAMFEDAIAGVVAALRVSRSAGAAVIADELEQKYLGPGLVRAAGDAVTTRWS